MSYLGPSFPRCNNVNRYTVFHIVFPFLYRDMKVLCMPSYTFAICADVFPINSSSLLMFRSKIGPLFLFLFINLAFCVFKKRDNISVGLFLCVHAL